MYGLHSLLNHIIDFPIDYALDTYELFFRACCFLYDSCGWAAIFGGEDLRRSEDEHKDDDTRNHSYDRWATLLRNENVEKSDNKNEDASLQSCGYHNMSVNVGSDASSDKDDNDEWDVWSESNILPDRFSLFEKLCTQLMIALDLGLLNFVFGDPKRRTFVVSLVLGELIEYRGLETSRAEYLPRLYRNETARSNVSSNVPTCSTLANPVPQDTAAEEIIRKYYRRLAHLTVGLTCPVLIGFYPRCSGILFLDDLHLRDLFEGTGLIRYRTDAANTFVPNITGDHLIIHSA